MSHGVSRAAQRAPQWPWSRTRTRIVRDPRVASDCFDGACAQAAVVVDEVDCIDEEPASDVDGDAVPLDDVSEPDDFSDELPGVAAAALPFVRLSVA